jgi:hypothetical protein
MDPTSESLLVARNWPGTPVRWQNNHSTVGVGDRVALKLPVQLDQSGWIV